MNYVGGYVYTTDPRTGFGWSAGLDRDVLVLVDRTLLYHNPADPCDVYATGWAYLPLSAARAQCYPCPGCPAVKP